MKKKLLKRRVGAFPSFNLFITFSIALFLINFTIAVYLHTTELTSYLQKNIELQVFLSTDASPQQITSFRNYLEKQDFVAKASDTLRISFVSKEKGAKAMIEETGEDFIAILEENPLPDAFHVYVKSDYYNDHDLQKIKRKLLIRDEVEEVEYPKNLIASINDNLSKLAWLVGIVGFLLIGSIFTIFNNVIRLALYSQRFLIRTMQLVGATSKFIKRPYIFRAVRISMLANFFAIGLIGGGLYYIYTFPDFFVLYNPTKLLVGCVISTCIAVFFAIVFSSLAVSKYLKMKLDELY